MKARTSTHAVRLSILAALAAGLVQSFAQGEPPPAYVPLHMSAHETVWAPRQNPWLAAATPKPIRSRIYTYLQLSTAIYT